MSAVRGQPVHVPAEELAERSRLAVGEAAAETLVTETTERDRAHDRPTVGVPPPVLSVPSPIVAAAVTAVVATLAVGRREPRQGERAVGALGKRREHLVAGAEGAEIEPRRQLEDAPSMVPPG